MTAEYLVINDCSDGETVETVCEGLPQFNTVPSLACKRRSREGEGRGWKKREKGRTQWRFQHLRIGGVTAIAAEVVIIIAHAQEGRNCNSGATSSLVRLGPLDCAADRNTRKPRPQACAVS